MFGGINPGQMKAMMQKLGMKQEEIEAERVIIEKADSKIVIEPVNVQKIVMQGQTSFQISGEIREETKAEGVREEDVKLVMEKTGASKKEALDALKQTGGDIAEAIVKLGD